PALLAALDEDTRERVRFVLAIGGYYDIEAVVTFFTTGYFRERPDGPWRHRTPNAYGKWIFVRNNADRLTDHAERATLAAMAERKLENPKAEIGDLVAKLGPEGRAVHALLVNDDPQRAPALIAALPGAVRADMFALDLKNQDLSKLAARLILVHGRDDAIIPYSESKALAAVAPQAELYVVDSLAHVDLGLSGLIDTVILWGAVYRLLAERDAAPPPAL
ncbi:MAG: alpha/beta fold hydrolase, partial [Alphaproteobacteria bacterium]